MTAHSLTWLDLLRHGEPVGGRKYRGQTDDPLSDKGWAEMRAAVAGERPWTAIVSSPLARCIEFAEWLALETGLPLAVDPRLKEVGFGNWEGKRGEDLTAQDPDLLFRFKHDPIGQRPEGAEPVDAFYRRVEAALADIHEQHAGGHPLVVAHAGVIRMAVCRTLGMPPANAYRINIASAALTRIKIERRAGRILESVVFLDRRP